ncbi:mitochondrial ribosomal protein S25-domain-containing protein, partial [Catenaria anguillulae PL171]
MPKAIPIFHNVTRMHQRGLIDRLPAWVPAMRLVPPSTPLPRAVCQTNVQGQQPFEQPANKTLATHYAEQIKSLYPQPKHLISSQLKHTRAARKLRPQQIVYPEDRLRQRFYRDHPFELVRAQTLVEESNRIEADYSTPLDKRPKPLTGEDVIKFQLHLVSTGLTIDEAYEKAVRDFRTVRMEEEAEVRRIAEKRRAAELTAWQKQAQVQGLPSFERSHTLKAKNPQNYEAWLQEDEASYNTQQAFRLRLETMKANKEQQGQ